GRSEPSCLDLPYIWVEQRSVALDQATREIDLLLWTRRDRQLRMVPDGDVEHITRSNAVRIGVVIQQGARDLLRTGAAGMFLRNEARGNRHEIQLVIAGCPDLAWSWLGTGQMLAGGPDTTGKEKGRHQRERAGPVGSIHVASIRVHGGGGPVHKKARRASKAGGPCAQDIQGGLSAAGATRAAGTTRAASATGTAGTTRARIRTRTLARA